jgi:hypothetical protein
MATSPIAISCEECTLENTEACQDCVVTFLLGPSQKEAVVVDVMEARAMRLLHKAGLLPELRFDKKVG